jgi:hypothetical protein
MTDKRQQLPDTAILIENTAWKVKVYLGLGGLAVLVILGFLYRVEAGIVALAVGLAYAGRVAIVGWHQHKLAQYEGRRIEADVRKVEAEADAARNRSFFIETNTGVFALWGGPGINQFYPAVSASKMFADVPQLALPEPAAPVYRSLLEIRFVHLLVVGPTDAGKTTVMCHLIDNAPNNALVICLDPHAKFNQWPGRVNKIIGRDEDYLSINEAMLDLIREKKERFAGNSFVFQPVYIVIDEWLIIKDKCPDALVFFEEIGSEARKVEMHLIIGSISATVDDLNVSGAIRDNLAQLTLSRTLKAQNLGEMKWSRADKELVELPGKYYPRFQLPARVEAARVEPVEDFEPLPVLDSGPKPYAPTADELKAYEMYLRGDSFRKISQEIFGSAGGNQITKIKEILRKFNVILGE